MQRGLSWVVGGVCLVGNRHSALAVPEVVVFDDNNSRTDNLQFLPEPPVVSVDIEREQVDLTCEVVLGQYRVHVLLGNPRADDFRWVIPGVGMPAEVLGGMKHLRLVCLDEKTLPPPVAQQIGRVCLVWRAKGELDASLGARPDQREDVQEDAVFVDLRVDAEPGVSHAGERAHPLQLLVSKCKEALERLAHRPRFIDEYSKSAYFGSHLGDARVQGVESRRDGRRDNSVQTVTKSAAQTPASS